MVCSWKSFSPECDEAVEREVSGCLRFGDDGAVGHTCIGMTMMLAAAARQASRSVSQTTVRTGMYSTVRMEKEREEKNNR